MSTHFGRGLTACFTAFAGLAVGGSYGLAPHAAAAADGSVVEYQLKAVALLRIAHFTDWPANSAQAPDPFVIGVLGNDPFGVALDETCEGERIAGRPVVVKRFGGLEQLERVDLLFVASSHRKALRRALSRLNGTPTLTVADFEGFVGNGGAVELFLDEGRVRFRIDRRAAEGVGLGLRSQLLRAATEVR